MSRDSIKKVINQCRPPMGSWSGLGQHRHPTCKMIQYNLTVPDSIGPLARDNRGHHGIPGTGRQRKPVVWSLLPARRTYPRNPPRRSRSDHDCCIMNTVCWMLDRNPAPAMQATGDGSLSYPVGKIPRCQRGRLIHVKRTPGSEWQAGHLRDGRGCLGAGVGMKATDGAGWSVVNQCPPGNSYRKEGIR